MYSAQAPAKINLGLHVLRRRNDGYHDVETVLLPIGWYDTLTVHADERVAMTCTDPELPTDERNLCVQAARLLGRTAEVSDGARIHLEKHIPYGAGLGGGSSDAAATLRLLCRLWDLSCTTDQLHALGRTLGADVPFFLHGNAAYAVGRGDELQRLDGYEEFPYTLIVVKPPVSVSTPDAYGLVRPHAENRPDLPELVSSNDLSRWNTRLTNDFEGPIFRRYPKIAAIKDELLQRQAAYASLSGSGTAVFGVFEQEAAADRAVRHFRERNDYTVWCGRAVPGS